MNIIIYMLYLVCVYLAFRIIEEIRWQRFSDRVRKEIKTDCSIDNCAVHTINRFSKYPQNPRGGDMFHNTKDGKIYIYSEKDGWLDFNVENDVE